MAAEHSAARNPLPPRIASLIRESSWIAMLGVVLFLLVILLTYSKSDPGWSHSLRVSGIRNAGGVIGAHLSDLLLYLFGVSAYWWVAFFSAFAVWGFRRIETTRESDRRSYVIVGIGFLVLLAASCGIEYLRLHSLKAALPLAPGGVIGAMVGGGSAQLLGFTGGTLVLFLMFAAGINLFTGVSWLTVIEKIGEIGRAHV